MALLTRRFGKLVNRNRISRRNLKRKKKELSEREKKKILAREIPPLIVTTRSLITFGLIVPYSKRRNYRRRL